VWVLLLGAASANALTAAVHGPPYSSVGASTVAFAAIGVLASQAFMSRWSGQRMRRRPWVVVVASLLLLLLTGTAAGSDVPGHSFGLLTGATLGAAMSLARRRPFPRIVEWALAAFALAVVVACWLIALA
jgi:uncharacterized membrane protein